MKSDNQYRELKEKHQQEVDAFPMAFAFSPRQFDKGMLKLGLLPEDTDKVYRIPGTGGFYRREDAPRFHEMFDRHGRETQEAVDGDATGGGFIFEMFLYELANHEYTYTGSFEDTLNALDLKPEDIAGDKRLRHGLKKAAAELRRLDRKKGF